MVAARQASELVCSPLPLSESVCLAKGFIAAQLDLAVEKKRRGNLVNKKDAVERGRGGARRVSVENNKYRMGWGPQQAS